MIAIIELRKNDSISTTMGRVSAAAGALRAPSSGTASDDGTRAAGVLLVAGSGMRISLVGLRLLRREALASGSGLAIVTSDVSTRMAATQLGISSFRSRGRAEKASWRPLNADSPVRLRGLGAADAEAPFSPGAFGPHSPSGFRPKSFVRAFVRRQSPWWAELGLLVAVLALLGGLIYALAIVVPAASITVTPAAESIQVSVPLTAVQDAVSDSDAGIVPARVLSVQIADEAHMPTTGKRLEPAEKAKGQVVLINRTGQPLTVPSGTIVTTATGNNARFATTVDAPIVAGGRANVPIEAVLPGPSGNVRAGTIAQVEGSLALSLLVANDAATSGGTVAPTGFVTEDDKTQLQALLFERMKLRALELLNERLGPGSFIPPESVTFMALSPTFTPFIGEVSPDLYLSMSVQAVGLMADTRSGNEVALDRLRSTMPPGTRLISDTLRFVPSSSVVVDARTISFSVTAEGTMLRAVDGSSVRATVLGLAPDEAARVLTERFALAQPASISLGPDWLPFIVPTNLPVLPWRIRVNVDWDGAARLATRR